MTAARTHSIDSSHWYTQQAKPVFEVPKADGSAMRKATLADARKLNLVPSVTTILQLLNKPELESWKIEQAVLSVLTTPRIQGELDDAFVKRVLSDERIQDAEAKLAREKGTEIHDAFASLFRGEQIDPKLEPWTKPAYEAVRQFGITFFAEQPIANHIYGGTADLALWDREKDLITVWDWKTTKNLPEKDSYFEHKLQLGAYARIVNDIQIKKTPPGVPFKKILVANCYVSTTEPGAYKIFTEPNWPKYSEGFMALASVWQLMKGYSPTPNEAAS